MRAGFRGLLRRFPTLALAVEPDEVAEHGVTTSSTQVRSHGGQLAELGALLDAGTLRVAIDSTYPP